MNHGNAALIIKAKNGDQNALQELVEANTGLVRSIAIRFTGRGVDFEDLCQIGHIGMLKAIRNFDIDRGTAFSTYAVPLIIGEIKRFLRDDGEIKIGRELKRKAAIVMAARERFISASAREPSVSELAAASSLSEEETVECITASAATISLSEQIGEDTTLENLLGNDFTPEINEKIALKQALETLPACEKKIIYLRYYKGLTQTETGRALGMTQVSVSRHEAKALLMLKAELK